MGNSGFKRARRLTHATEYDAVFRHPDYRISSPEVLVLAIETPNTETRVGTVVSKKVSRTSVARNRYRRLIKESFRTRISVPGLDIVVVARPGIAKRSNVELLSVLDGLWQGLLSKRQKAAT